MWCTKSSDMLEDAISTGPRWLYVISGYKMQITPCRQSKSAPFAHFCDHLFILGSIYTTHWRHWHGGTGIITPFQTVAAIGVLYKPVLTSGAPARTAGVVIIQVKTEILQNRTIFLRSNLSCYCLYLLGIGCPASRTMRCKEAPKKT